MQLDVFVQFGQILVLSCGRGYANCDGRVLQNDSHLLTRPDCTKSIFLFLVLVQERDITSPSFVGF